MLSVFESWLVGRGVEAGIAELVAIGAGVLVVLVLAAVADLVAKRVLLRAVLGLARRTETNWDNAVIKRRVSHRLANLFADNAGYITDAFREKFSRALQQQHGR